MPIAETATWEPEIYELKTTDKVEGGPDGISNLQPKQLANRTKFLHGVAERQFSAVDSQDVVATVAVQDNNNYTSPPGSWLSYGADLGYAEVDVGDGDVLIVTIAFYAVKQGFIRCALYNPGDGDVKAEIGRELHASDIGSGRTFVWRAVIVSPGWMTLRAALRAAYYTDYPANKVEIQDLHVDVLVMRKPGPL